MAWSQVPTGAPVPNTEPKAPGGRPPPQPRRGLGAAAGTAVLAPKAAGGPGRPADPQGSRCVTATCPNRPEGGPLACPPPPPPPPRLSRLSCVSVSMSPTPPNRRSFLGNWPSRFSPLQITTQPDSPCVVRSAPWCLSSHRVAEAAMVDDWNCIHPNKSKKR